MERFYSLKSAAEMLDISIRTLRELIKSEGMDLSRVGKRLRLSESQVKFMIKPQKRPKPTKPAKPVKAIVDEILRT